jgi:DNA-directed RNA polymerase specialized sigma subunit
MPRMREIHVKSRHQQIVEARFGEPIDALLTRLYVVEGRSQAEIAETLGVSRQAVVRWMTQLGIESRFAPKPAVA